MTSQQQKNSSATAMARGAVAAAVAVAALAGTMSALHRPAAFAAPSDAAVPQAVIQQHNKSKLAFGTPFGLVWAHMVPGERTPYGGQQVNGLVNTFDKAKQDGIDAICFNTFARPNLIENPLTAADQAGILMAPTIDMSGLYRKQHLPPDQIVQAEAQTILGYIQIAQGHRSAAKTRDGAYVIWFYGSNQLPPEMQQQALTAARAQGAKFFAIGALGGHVAGRNRDANPVPTVAAYSDVWDASYAFLPIDDSIKGEIKGNFANRNRTLIASVMPQYTRQGMENVINLAPDGGRRYAALWQEAIEDRSPAVVITTLNDKADGTNIMPDYETQTQQFAQQWKSQVVNGR